MKILYVATTPYSGMHLRQADLVGRLGHETRVLTPATWEPKITRLGPKRDVVGRAYWIGDEEIVNACLDWAEAIHFNLNTSLRHFNREDLLSEKALVWHLSTKWKPGFMRHFPGDSHKYYKFVLSAEGWDRYELPPWGWRNIPVLFPINDPLWRPIPFEKRRRRATMTPRIESDEWEGKPIPAPRGVAAIKDALAGQPFDVITGVGFAECMREKASSWVGIDDVVNPMLHLSGFEYLSLGVPCVNKKDEHIERVLKDVTGGSWPFFDAQDILKRFVELTLVTPGNARLHGECVRSWMERYYSGERMAERYVELYR